MKIHYLKGDATVPIMRPAIIPHICNDEGGWGAGFVLALSRKWKEPEKAYRLWHRGLGQTTIEQPFELGKTQIVRVKDDITVANMIAQHGIGIRNGVIPLRYDALRKCLSYVYSSFYEGETIHMPRIGSGLAGGSWSEVEKILKDVATVDTYVYDL